jgi:hypothetical protein
VSDDIEEFGGDQAAPANGSRRARQSVAARGGLPDLPLGKQPLPRPVQTGAPQAEAQASDGGLASISRRHIQDTEAPIVQPAATTDVPVGYRQTDLLGADAQVEHSCGHIGKARLWKDAERQKAQLARILKAGRCFQCSGRK